MTRLWMPGLALILTVVLAPASFAGFVKKKDGQILQGSINGLIVLASEERSVKEGEKVRYLQVHIIEQGKDVLSLDEDGVQMAAASEMVICSLSSTVAGKAGKLSDLGVRLTMAHMLSDMLDGPRAFEPNADDPDKGQWKITIMTGVQQAKAKSHGALKLLGELRNGKIIPALEVVTAGGTVTVPVDDIVTPKSNESR